MRLSACDTVPRYCAPARALLTHIPLGPRPWLHQLRGRLPGLVRRLHSYYGGVRLLMIVHHRLRLLAFPTRTSAARMWRWPTMRSPGSRAKSVRTCQCLRPRRAVWALALSRPSVLPSVSGTTSAPGMRVLSRLNGWPMRSLSTLRRCPRGHLRMTLGRCGSHSFIVMDLHHLLLAGLPAHSALSPKADPTTKSRNVEKLSNDGSRQSCSMTSLTSCRTTKFKLFTSLARRLKV